MAHAWDSGHAGASWARSDLRLQASIRGQCPREVPRLPQSPGVLPRRLQKAAGSPHARHLDTAAGLRGPRRASSKIKSMNDGAASLEPDKFSASIVSQSRGQKLSSSTPRRT